MLSDSIIGADEQTMRAEVEKLALEELIDVYNTANQLSADIRNKTLNLGKDNAGWLLLDEIIKDVCRERNSAAIRKELGASVRKSWTEDVMNDKDYCECCGSYVGEKSA